MIKPAFIDVDFTQETRFGRGDLGMRAIDAQRFASYADEAPVYPESQWREMADAIQKAGGGCSALVTRIYNQKQEASCVANATSQSHEITQAKQFGKDRVVHLSAISLYKRIGRSPSSGAMVSDGLEEMAERGILPLDDEANRARFGQCVMPNTGFSTKYPANWEQTAANFRVHEWLVLNSVAELISALLNQQPVVVGRSGHSICYCDAIYEDGKLLVKYANSWSGDWGEEGFGYDSLKLIKSSANWAFAPRSVVVPTFQVSG